MPRYTPWFRAFLSGFFLLGPVVSAHSDYVVASDDAVVRVSPDPHAAPLEWLKYQDKRLCLVDADGQPSQRDDHYHVVLPDGRQGWVSKYPVRVRRGPIPTPKPAVSNASAARSTLTEAQAETFRRRHSELVGEPQGQVVLVNEGYLLGYDPRLKIATWVQYHLRSTDFPPRKRKTSFRKDPRLEPQQQSFKDDYSETRDTGLWKALKLGKPENYYAKGHMIPDRSQTRSPSLQSETYFMSNMSPQVQNGFNSGTWSDLEDKIRDWCTARGELIVIAGPVFLSAPRQVDPHDDPQERIAVMDPDSDEPLVRAQPPTERQVVYNVIGEREVAVPSALFCIVLDAEDLAQPQSLAFIIHNARRTPDEGRELDTQLVSIDEIERKTGLDVLSGLPDTVEDLVEAGVAAELWE